MADILGSLDLKLESIKKKDNEATQQLQKLVPTKPLSGNSEIENPTFPLDDKKLFEKLEEMGLGGLKYLLDVKNLKPLKDIMGPEKEESLVQSGNVQQPNKEGQYSVTVGGDLNSSLIVGAPVFGDVTLGETAKSRQKEAVERINLEILDNFKYLSSLVGSIEILKPELFWDVRKVNETEQNYQTRAEAHFQKYKGEVLSQIAKSRFSNEIYKSFKNQIIEENLLSDISTLYGCFDEVIYHINNYDTHLNHLLSLNLEDRNRAVDCLSKHREILISSKIKLLDGAAWYFRTFKKDIHGQDVLESLWLANINVPVLSGQKAFSQCYVKIAEYSKEKQELLKERIVIKQGGRKVDPYIRDPYVAMLRKTMGLGETLGESEIQSLVNREIDMHEKDPNKLFSLAAYSYHELDGEASIIYLERALQSEEISPKQRNFAEKSLHRLKNPNFYQGSLGVIVCNINKDGGFDRAGLKEGDVIIAIDGQPILEPFDISSALASEKAGNPILLMLVRDEAHTKVIIKAGESAGAALSQLVTPKIFQI